MSVYYFNDEASQRNPSMVITPGHSQPILSTGFEGDFSLTLGFWWATFSFSFPAFCSFVIFGGSAEQLLEKLLSSLAFIVCVMCANGYLSSLVMPAASWDEMCWAIWPQCFPRHCQTCIVLTVCVCVYVWSAVSPICCPHFESSVILIVLPCGVPVDLAR